MHTLMVFACSFYTLILGAFSEGGMMPLGWKESSAGRKDCLSTLPFSLGFLWWICSPVFLLMQQAISSTPWIKMTPLMVLCVC